MQDMMTLAEFDLDEEFDPLAEDEIPTLTDEMDDDDPNDIVDLPIIPNMPEGAVRAGVFDARSYDDPRKAVQALFEKNPGRKPIYLGILTMCAEGKASSEITEEVVALQSHNASVYAPMSLCRALERAGALELEQPENVGESKDDPAAFREITERVDPVWTTTALGKDVLEYEKSGAPLQELLAFDEAYITIYERVLAFCDEQPRTKPEIDEIVDNDPLVQNPRRYSNHFVELLEQRGALIWHENAWNITDLGKATLSQMEKSHD